MIKVNGLVNVYGMKFHDIEGGFGEGKKAMLVKDIANIHGRELKDINRNINKNIKRFTKGIDLVDLKGTEFEVILNHHGIYTQNAINRSDNIYLLSERGYSKLLKILEDDFAWEQYDKLVDGYFQMREQLKQAQPSYMIEDPIKRAEQWIEEQKEKQRLLEENTKNKPKVDYYEKVLNPSDVENGFTKLITTTDIAKDLGMTATKLNKKLHELGVIYKSSKLWKVYDEYKFLITDGYCDYHIHEHGQTLKWTEKGRQWIINLLGGTD